LSQHRHHYRRQQQQSIDAASTAVNTARENPGTLISHFPFQFFENARLKGI